MFKKTALLLLGVTLLFSAYALLSGKTYLFKAVIYNFANINNYKKFTNNTVSVSTPQPWDVSPVYNKIRYPDTLNSLLKGLGSVGLLMIKIDSVLF